MTCAPIVLLFSCCGDSLTPERAIEADQTDTDQIGGKPDGANQYADLNLAAGAMVLYEVQVRTANACRTDTGALWQQEACERRIAPEIPYRAEGMSCSTLDDLQQIRLGTLDDMLEDTTDYRDGISLRYIDETVGANTVWLMPIFPNNDTWSIPDACDNLGSPYAVRDYLHVRGTLSRDCILEGRDENSAQPCWSNDTLERFINDAHQRGLRVLFDLAFNHFGHNYQMYDYVDFHPVRDRLAAGANPYDLWSFSDTHEAALLHPEILQSPEQLVEMTAESSDHAQRLEELQTHCPDLSGQDLVVAYNTWRVALDWERQQFPCDSVFLESTAPGFYLGANQWDPATRLGDNFTNDWRDVKFLFHHESNLDHVWEYVRQREYLFRIMNYWVSRGVDGFRLDHATDSSNGLGPNEWRYIISKVNYYAQLRGQAIPVYLAEEFHHQQEIAQTVDILTEGYVRDMTGRYGITKDAHHIEWVVSNMDRFGGHTYVMTALETHDEDRLTDGTGFNTWTGAGFWSIGTATWSTPMLLMGQEFGESWGLGFRRNDFLRARFEGTENFQADGQQLVDFYRSLITERLAHSNRALYASNYAFLDTRIDHSTDPRALAMVKWTDDGNVVFVFNNLWEEPFSQSYYIPDDLAENLLLREDLEYVLVDVFTDTLIGECRTGAELKWDLPVFMEAHERVQWLRLERCPQQ